MSFESYFDIELRNSTVLTGAPDTNKTVLALRILIKTRLFWSFLILIFIGKHNPFTNM